MNQPVVSNRKETMMNPKPILFAALSLGLLGLSSTPSLAQISKQGDGYLFRMKFTPGAKASYTMTMSGIGAPGAAGGGNMTMKLVQVVKSVANGVGTIEFTVSGGMVPKPMVQTMKMDGRGKVVGGGQNMQQIQQVELPANAMKIGSTWKGQMKSATQMGEMTTNYTYKFVGLKKIGKNDCAQIFVTNTATGASLKTSGSGNVFLRLADGSMETMNMNQKVTISNPQTAKPMTINPTMTMARS